MNSNKLSLILMIMLIFLWGLDYSVAKNALQLFEPLNLMFFKYAGGFVVLTIIKLIVDKKIVVRKKDVWIFMFSSAIGHLLYYFCEYTAMGYLPISTITIILAFMPAVSIIIERVIFKKKISVSVGIGIAVSIIGITFVVGGDFRELLEGKLIGYLLAVVAVLAWNVYNFVTSRVSQRYTSLEMAFNQLMCTSLLSLPFAINMMPPAESFTPDIILSLIYLGGISAGIGYIIFLRAIRDLGPTIASMFANFLPLTSTFFGWLLLGQGIKFIQIIGGIIVVIASCFVIMEKDKSDRLTAIAKRK